MLFDENGFEYYKEDDDMLRDDIDVAIYLQNNDVNGNGVTEWFEALNNLKESVDIHKIESGEVLVANLVFQQNANESKIRPCVFICARNNKALVFQITSFNPENTKREDFQYEIQDLNIIGCKKRSWINFDHYVVADSESIVDKVIGQLSYRDRRGLIDKMKECAVKHNNNLKYPYNDIIKFLKGDR